MVKVEFVIGISGLTGSGKTTLSKSLAQKLRIKRVSFGDYVRKVVRSRKLEETRRNLQAVGQELVQQDPNSFCVAVLENAKWKGEPIVIEGIRHLEVLIALSKLMNPLKLVLIYIELQENIRNSRLLDRNLVDSHREMIDKHESEQQVKYLLKNKADLCVDGNKNVEFLVVDIVNWLDKLKNS